MAARFGYRRLDPNRAIRRIASVQSSVVVRETISSGLVHVFSTALEPSPCPSTNLSIWA